MTQYKECSVVLLDTDKSNIAKDTATNSLQYFSKVMPSGNILISKYLYILSDDEIKEGDWYYDKLIKNISNLNISYQGGCKKVIATTNPELIQQGVATVSDGWLQEYCNNPIDKVLIEYELDYDLIGEQKIREAQKEFEKRHGYWLDIKSERKRDKSRPSSFDYLYYNSFHENNDTITFYYNEQTPHDCPYFVDLEVPKSEYMPQPKLTSENTLIIKPLEDTWDNIFEKYAIDIYPESTEPAFKRWLALNYNPPTKK